MGSESIFSPRLPALRVDFGAILGYFQCNVMAFQLLFDDFPSVFIRFPWILHGFSMDFPIDAHAISIAPGGCRPLAARLLAPPRCRAAARGARQGSVGSLKLARQQRTCGFLGPKAIMKPKDKGLDMKQHASAPFRHIRTVSNCLTIAI